MSKKQVAIVKCDWCQATTQADSVGGGRDEVWKQGWSRVTGELVANQTDFKLPADVWDLCSYCVDNLMAAIAVRAPQSVTGVQP